MLINLSWQSSAQGGTPNYSTYIKPPGRTPACVLDPVQAQSGFY